MERRLLLNLPGGFDKVDRMRRNASAQLVRDRHVRRTATFNSRRNISEKDMQEAQVLPPQPVDQKVANRKLALQKFKDDKEARRKAIKEKQKPPFKVGIPHHGSSPVLREVTNVNLRTRSEVLKKKNEPEVRRITRATTREKRNIHGKAKEIKSVDKNINKQVEETYKAPFPVGLQVFPFKNQTSVFHFQANIASSTKKLTSPHTPTVLKRSVKKMPLEAKRRQLHLASKKTIPSKSSASSVEALAAPLSPEVLEDEVFGANTEETVAVKVEKSETEDSSETPLLLPKEEPSDKDLPRPRSSRTIVTSPNMELIAKEEPSDSLDSTSDDAGLLSKVCTQRGKKSNLKSKTPDSQSNADPERIKEVAMHRGRLDEETGELLGLAKHWEVLALRENLPSEVQDEVDSIVGQTRLLTRDKFNQFRGLIDQFEKKEGERPITVDDLNGFWDMIYIQVEMLTNKYGKLQRLKENNWVEKEDIKTKTKVTTKLKRLPKASSSIRTFLQAKRLKTVESSNESNTEGLEHMVPLSATRESLTAQVLIGRRTRSNSPSPYIAMRLSGAGRPSPSSVQVDVVPDVTPRSILRAKHTQFESLRKTTPLNVLSEAKTHEELPEKTPRRSMRLLNKTPTPIKNRLCAICGPLYCSDCECKNTELRAGQRSRRKILPLAVQPDVPSKETTCPVVAVDASKPSGSGPRFVLQPSKLEAVANLGAIPKTRMSKRLKQRKSKASSPLPDFESSSHSSRKTRLNSSERSGTPN